MTRLADPSDVAYLAYPVIPLRWLFALARFFGTATYYLQRGPRSTVRRNLERAFGSTKSARELDILTRQFFEYKRIRAAMLAIAPRLSGEQLAKLLRIEGLERLDAALRQNRGVILLGSHINSVCLFLTTMALRERGYNVRTALPVGRDPWPASRLRMLLNRTFKTKSLKELIGGFYAQFNVRPIVRQLADNAIVVQTGDGLHSARFAEVDFLGQKVAFTSGMASVAQLTGSVVVPVFQLGAPPDRLRTVMEEPWTVQRDAGADAALERAVKAYAKRLEAHLLENVPCWEHWLIEDTLATLASWPERPLEERYRM
jgi:lauroyl/myristoyl acyltransferase